MTDDEKQPYQIKAALERERVATETELWKKAAIAAGMDIHSKIFNNPNNKDDTKAESNGLLTLPVGRVRKICRLDPDVRGVSKEAVVLITKATEMFTIHLGHECIKTAHIQNRRTLLPQDVVDVCQIRESLQFLKDDMNDLHRQQQEHKHKVALDTKNSSNSTKGKLNHRAGGTAATTSTKPLTDYFKPVA
jgi:DNA-directed RNA polymerase I subunit RPA43